MSAPVCVYDANVLYPAQLRDLLMRLAIADLVRAHWTEAIHDEWTRNVLADYPSVTREDLKRTRALMEQALPTAEIRGYEHHVRSLSLPDSDDRHVLAAAVEAGADVIVTFNTKDFPPEPLDPHGVSALHPDDLVVSLLDRHAVDVLAVMRRHRASLRRPPKSPAEYVELLRRAGLGRTANRVDDRKEAL